MATYGELKGRYAVLHRYMCGIAAICLIIAITGGTLYSDSNWLESWTSCTEIGWRELSVGPICYNLGVATLLTGWAAVIVTGVVGIEYFILKVWAAWEDVSQGSRTDHRRRRRV